MRAVQQEHLRLRVRRCIVERDAADEPLRLLFGAPTPRRRRLGTAAPDLRTARRAAGAAGTAGGEASTRR